MPIHHRHSIRLPDYDYSSPGAYYITLVTWQREILFGEIVEGEMRLSEWGFLVKNEWLRLTDRFPNIQLDEFMVMPNHFHGIVCIIGTDDANDRANGVGARQNKESTTGNHSLASPLPGNNAPLPVTKSPLPPSFLPTPPESGSLGNFVGAFKSTTARLINGLRHSPGQSVWQRNYYEHIIRNQDEWQRIRLYIQANPNHWQLDNENPLKVR